MILSKKMVGLAIVLSLIPIYLVFYFHNKKVDQINTSQILLPTESEKVIVDPRRHKITLITETHSKEFTLPDRPSVISVLKGDGIKIVSPQFGTEFRPYLGAAYTLSGGVILGGVDVFYWKALDVSLGLSLDPTYVQRAGVFVGFSYVAYSNCSVGVGLDNHVTPILFVKVRL